MDLENILKETRESPESRVKYIKQLDGILEQLPASPKLVYKILRNLCIESNSHQDLIYSKLHPFSKDSLASPEYLQLLYNLCVQNPRTSEYFLSFLPALPLTPSTVKYTIMLYHIISHHSTTTAASLISQHPHHISTIIHLLPTYNDEQYEWANYLLIRLVPGNLQRLLQLVDSSDLPEFFRVLSASVEDSYLKRQNIFTPTHLNMNLTHDDFSELCYFYSAHDLYREELIELINIALRSPNEALQSIFFNSPAFQKTWESVRYSTEKLFYLQTLANAVKDFPPAAAAAVPQLLHIVQLQEYKLQAPLVKEWWQLLIQFTAELCPELGPQLKEALAHSKLTTSVLYAAITSEAFSKSSPVTPLISSAFTKLL